MIINISSYTSCAKLNINTLHFTRAKYICICRPITLTTLHVYYNLHITCCMTCLPGYPGDYYCNFYCPCYTTNNTQNYDLHSKLYNVHLIRLSWYTQLSFNCYTALFIENCPIVVYHAKQTCFLLILTLITRYSRHLGYLFCSK